MELDDKTKKLIAIGACVTANCKPCLEKQVSQGRGIGIGTAEIELAIKIGQSVRKGSAEHMDEFIDSISATNICAGDSTTKTKPCCC